VKKTACLSSIVLLIAAAPAAADTVELANGDHLTGTVVRLADGKLVLATDWGGEISVDWGQVTALSTDGPYRLVLEDGSELVGALAVAPAPAPAGELTVTGEGTAEPGPVARAAIAEIQPVDRPAVEWEGHVAAGFVASEGNTETESLYGEGEVVARTEWNRYTAGGQATRAEDDGRETADNARAWLGYDRFLSERWYLAASALFSRDEFQDLSLRSAVALSAGYQAIDTERTRLSGELGASYVDEDFDTAPDDSYPAARWALDVGHDLVIDRIELFHDHEGFLGLESSDDLLVRSRTGLRFHLFEGFVAATQVNLDYDESPAPGFEKEDRRYLVNVGFQW
jgi:putative salt-induced outer membrane protein YdiY